MRFHPHHPSESPGAGLGLWRRLVCTALISAAVLVCMSPATLCVAAGDSASQLAAKPPLPPASPEPPPTEPCEWPPAQQDDLRALLGPADAALLAAPDGCRLVAVHADRQLIPASTLKLLTAAAALHHLGPDYRFVTDFYTDASGNLKVKGYGDPLLVSEVVAELSAVLAPKLGAYRDLVIDDHWFAQPLLIPGRSQSLQPYDAPNGALCVNFNTVFFKRIDGKPVSAEDQTPLLPFALEKIEASGQAQGRIGLSAGAAENVRYSGELLRHFLEQAGARGGAVVRSGRVTAADERIHRHLSPHPLTEVIEKLMAYSNNFMANQIFITTGIVAGEPPGTLAKARATVERYAVDTLGLRRLKLVEGSGISRRNRMSAEDLLRVLDAFAPYHELLRQEDNEYYKTGTLDGIRTRAGYLQSDDGRLYRFVVLLNTAGKTTDRVMALLKSHLP